MPSPEEVDAFRHVVSGLGTLAVQDVVNAWRQVSDASPEAMQAFLLEATPDALEPYIIGASELAVAWYDELDPDAAYTATPADPPPLEQVQASVRWAMGPEFARGVAPVQSLLAGMAQRYVLSGARNTIVQNAETERVRWARHASANACAFCRMLATRGAVYSSRDRAMRAHDHCHCMAVPDRRGSPYQAPAYVTEWTAEYKTARSESDGSTAGILAALRRND